MPLTSISLAVSCQENATFPWLPNKTAKKVLNLLGVLDNPAKEMLVFPWRTSSAAKKYRILGC